MIADSGHVIAWSQADLGVIFGPKYLDTPFSRYSLVILRGAAFYHAEVSQAFLVLCFRILRGHTIQKMFITIQGVCERAHRF